MLALTRKSDYALVALTHLARAGDRLSTAREVADVYHVPLPILMNVLKSLTRFGMVESVRGAKGGYRLGLAADEISLQMVVNAMEGPARLFQCSSSGSGRGTCEQENWCPITVAAKRVSGRFQEFLGGVTLAEIAADEVHTISTNLVGHKKSNLESKPQARMKV